MYLEMNFLAFTINDYAGNLASINIPSTIIPLSYSRSEATKWFYCNYPEHTQAGSNPIATAQNGYYLNQQSFSAGTHQIFYSYYNNPTGAQATNFGIRIKNTSSGPITVTRQNHGHYCGAQNDPKLVAGEPWKQFFNSSSYQYPSITPGNDAWLYNYSIPVNYMFSGNTRIYVTGSFQLTAFLYNTLPSSTTVYKAYPIWNATYGSADPRQYSGSGFGYYSTASTITVKASQLSTGVYFKVNDPSMSNLSINGLSSSSDLIRILQVGNNALYQAPSANLGNWCAQNYYALTLQNDMSNPVTFNGYIREDSTNTACYPVFQSGTVCKYGRIALAEGSNAWRWLTVTVPKSTSITDSFQYILGTNSPGTQQMIFKL